MGADETTVLAQLDAAQTEDEKLDIEAKAIEATDNSARDGDGEDQLTPLVVNEEGTL